MLQSAPTREHASTLEAFRESCRARLSECAICVSMQSRCLVKTALNIEPTYTAASEIDFVSHSGEWVLVENSRSLLT